MACAVTVMVMKLTRRNNLLIRMRNLLNRIVMSVGWRELKRKLLAQSSRE